MPLPFMVIILRTLVTYRPPFEDATPKMALTPMHRLIAACQER